MTAPVRHRLPNRRPAVTEEIASGGMRLTATIGFDPAGSPAEIFLTGAKDGSELSTFLTDASIVISIALQCGIPAALLCKSISRLSEAVSRPPIALASPIGAALDLLACYEQVQDS